MARSIYFLASGFLFLGLGLLAQNVEETGNKKDFIYKVTIVDAITPASMEKLVKAIKKANDEKASAIILQLDTPGGLMSSMDEMVKSIMNSRVPVITFVAPPGASCGSAGVFILMASHVAAMAPATNIGSATPVSMGRTGQETSKEDEEALRKKLLNHSIAKIKSITEFYGRNSEFAIKTITEAANIPSTEALRIKLIDLIASSEEELLSQLNGRTVKTIEGEKKLQFENVEIVELQDDLRNRILSIVANPNIAYILIMIGIAGIMMEIQYPGLIFPGVIGAISLLLGLYGLQTIPVDYTGFLLIALGIILLILELKIMSYGLLAIAGILSIALGIIWIADSMKEIKTTSLAVIITSTVFIVALLLFVIYKVIQASKKEVVSGDTLLFKEMGEAVSDVTSTGGKVFIHGEYWNAVSKDGIIPRGSRIRPVERQGMTLIVKKVDEIK